MPSTGRSGVDAASVSDAISRGRVSARACGVSSTLSTRIRARPSTTECTRAFADRTPWTLPAAASHLPASASSASPLTPLAEMPTVSGSIRVCVREVFVRRVFITSAFAMLTSSPVPSRRRVVLRPTLSTRPVISPTTISSPMANGLSNAIASAANRSPRVFCTASATAMPVMPRPVTSAVTLMPKLSSASTITITNTATRISTPTTASDARPL